MPGLTKLGHRKSVLNEISHFSWFFRPSSGAPGQLKSSARRAARRAAPKSRALHSKPGHARVPTPSSNSEHATMWRWLCSRSYGFRLQHTDWEGMDGRRLLSLLEGRPLHVRRFILRRVGQSRPTARKILRDLCHFRQWNANMAAPPAVCVEAMATGTEAPTSSGVGKHSTRGSVSSEESKTRTRRRGPGGDGTTAVETVAPTPAPSLRPRPPGPVSSGSLSREVSSEHLHHPSTRFLFFGVNYGRFNNQLVSVLKALALAKTLNRTVVLPPFTGINEEVPWPRLFDEEPLLRRHRIVYHHR